MFLLALVLASTIATKADVPRLTPAELGPLLESGDAIAIDVRGSVPYKLGRIAGATWLPLGKVGERAAELPKDKLLVAYCTCGAEELSLDAALVLAQKGFTRVAVLKGGYPAWKEAGLPVETDRPAAEPAPAPAAAPVASGGRLRPPDAVTCDRNQLTSYAGKVTSYRRERGLTRLVIHTSAETIETVSIRHTGDDPSRFYLLDGAPFKAADWSRIERRKGVLRDGVSVVAWVCENGTSIVDWRPGTTFTGAE
ncbi:MAG TPA: rhodanese-like domain-containing protein [Thermoanaerobaculia bacterium]|jgi:rhodanese-related sulfurtransferase